MTAPDNSRYRLTRRLGIGGMGEVWEAEDTLLRRQVALKFLPPDVAENAQARRQLLEEARASSVLNHPGIATVYDTGDLDGRTFIAMRLVDGETLREKLRRGLLPLSEATRLATEIAEALDHAHSQGVVHGDLSPRNVMVTGQGHAVVVDFGLAHRDESSFVGDTTQSDSTAGTAGFLAPEVVRGEKPGQAADLYSLGVLLYEMLTGTRPFTGERAEAILYATLNTAPEPPSRRRAGIEPRLEKIVLSTLAKAPGDRPDSAAALATALQGLAKGRHRSARILVATATRPFPWVIAATLATAIVAVLVWSSFRQPPAGDEIRAIAVLPFVNLAKGPGTDEHLAEGLTRSLISKIVNSTDIRVVSWLSVGSYRGQDISPAAARDLKVDALVVGRYRSRNGRISCQVQLLDGATGSTLWSEEFHAAKTEIFVLEARMARRLAGGLGAVVAEGQDELPASTGDPQAYELYLKAARIVQIEAKNGTEIAEALLNKALGFDPDLALAHVALGALDSQRYFFGWAGRGSLEQAEAHYKEALRLEPTLPAAHSGLISAYWGMKQPERMLKQAQLALTLGLPRSEELFLVGRTYTLTGLQKLALPVLDELIDLEPNHQGAHWFRVFARNWAGDFEGAINAGLIYQERFEDNAEVALWVGLSLLAADRPDDALMELETALRLFGRDTSIYARTYMALAYERAEKKDQARTLFQTETERLETLLMDAPDNDGVLGHLLTLHVHLHQWEKFDTTYKLLQELGAPSQWRANGDAFVPFLAQAGGERTAQAMAIWRDDPPKYLFYLHADKMFRPALADYPGGDEVLALSLSRYEYLLGRYGNLLGDD